MLCYDCPALSFTEEQLTEIRRKHPGYAQRPTCCQTEGKLKEMEELTAPDRLGAGMIKQEMQAGRPYDGPPRNRHERRAATKRARG